MCKHASLKLNVVYLLGVTTSGPVSTVDTYTHAFFQIKTFHIPIFKTLHLTLSVPAWRHMYPHSSKWTLKLKSN